MYAHRICVRVWAKKQTSFLLSGQVAVGEKNLPKHLTNPSDHPIIGEVQANPMPGRQAMQQHVAMAISLIQKSQENF